MRYFKIVVLFVVFFTAYLTSFVANAQLNLADQQDLAERVTDKMNYVAVSAVPSPEIVGQPPKAVFWIRNNEDRDYTYMFGEGDYTFGINDPENVGVGPYLCDVVAETDHQLPRLEWRFLRDVRIGGTVEIKIGSIQVGTNIDGLEPMVREIFAAVRYIGDWVLEREDAKFYLLIRGHADAGAGFTRQLLPHPNNFVTINALPPTPQDPTGLNRYQENSIEISISDPYSNDQLPELRSRFLQKLIDEVWSTCGVADFKTQILKGTTIMRSAAPSLRRVDLFLYVY